MVMCKKHIEPDTWQTLVNAVPALKLTVFFLMLPIMRDWGIFGWLSFYVSKITVPVILI